MIKIRKYLIQRRLLFNSSSYDLQYYFLKYLVAYQMMPYVLLMPSVLAMVPVVPRAS